ncbi:hypothetical protein [Fimbriimonas ginsengisoli]|uniref:hypothetical protein n=1 Tax=Fimbriimonas ginsengisoli TaxID=1005039 RepID=UPI0011862694|nr:hypothetical protein [Fimbriimonas ginsengisoli]
MISALRRRTWIRILFGAIALSGVGGFLYARSHGGLVEVFELPATLDESTPSLQNGASILGIMRSTKDLPRPILANGELGLMAAASPIGSTHVWVQLPPGAGRADYRGFQVTARTSDGKRFNLDWQTADVGDGIVSVAIPPGYPLSTKWIDLDVRSERQPARTWRIVNLPKPRRLVNGPARVSTEVDGVKLEGHATIDDRAQKEGEPTKVDAGISVQSLTGGSEIKTVCLDGTEFEWSPGVDNGMDWTGGTIARPTGSTIGASLMFAFAPLNRWVLLRGMVRTYRQETTTTVLHGVTLNFISDGPKKGYTVEVLAKPISFGGGKRIELCWDLMSKPGYFFVRGLGGTFGAQPRPSLPRPVIPLKQRLALGPAASAPTFGSTMRGFSVVSSPRPAPPDESDRVHTDDVNVERIFVSRDMGQVMADAATLMKSGKSGTLPIGDVEVTLRHTTMVSKHPFDLIVPLKNPTHGGAGDY